VSDAQWESHAAWWIDGYTDGADPEYAEQIVPLAASELIGARRVLDVGCGEGQITRAAAALDGVELAVGIDPTWNQITVARERGRASGFARAGADGLPFPDGSFDAVVACLVFEHIDAVDRAIAEVSRVLRPGGRFCFFLNHPLMSTPESGWIDDHVVDPPEQYWRVGPYLPEAVTVEEVEPGIHIRFVHRPLSRYVNALADNGLLVERMVEPAPPPAFLALAPEYGQAVNVPRLLYLRSVKTAAD
jgi:SAM-dependent methyltransferase